MAAKVKFIMKGKPVTLEQARKAAALFVDARAGKVRVVHVFRTRAEHDRWARKSEFAEEIGRLEKLAARARKYRHTDHSAAMRRQKAAVKRITSDLKKLAARTGLPMGSKKLFQQATGGGHPLDVPIFDPAVLFEHINRRGRAVPLSAGAAFPNFTWFGFNDKTSSVTITGTITLWTNIWYSGPSLTISGPKSVWPPVTLNLTNFGFNDVASSAICVV